jgi:hypothetical protein
MLKKFYKRDRIFNIFMSAKHEFRTSENIIKILSH